jgi:hypothetical protein
MRSNGLAGATILILVKFGVLEGLRQAMVRDFRIMGVGECRIGLRSERDLLKDGIDMKASGPSLGLAVVGESFMSIDASLSSASCSLGPVERFNLLLTLGSFFIKP